MPNLWFVIPRLRRLCIPMDFCLCVQVSAKQKFVSAVCRTYGSSSRGFAAYASTWVSAYECKHPPQKTMRLRTYSLTGAYSSAG